MTNAVRPARSGNHYTPRFSRLQKKPEREWLYAGDINRRPSSRLTDICQPAILDGCGMSRRKKEERRMKKEKKNKRTKKGKEKKTKKK